MPKFIYRAFQVIIDDSNEWEITNKAIKVEYEIEAISEKEAWKAGNEQLSIEHPELPLKQFLTQVL